MNKIDQFERNIVAAGLLALASSAGALAAALGATALDHMTASANLCVPGAGHCLSCIGALSCLTAALVIAGWGASQLTPPRAGVAAGRVRDR